jgi:hypothetical protein
MNRVADFNTLPEIIAHAQREGATHVIVNTIGDAWLYFPIGDGKAEEARVRRERGYYHADGPEDRFVRRMPRTAIPIEKYLARNEPAPHVPPAMFENRRHVAINVPTSETIRQGTVLVAKSDFQFKAPGSRGRSVVARTGDRFWVTNSMTDQMSSGVALIQREGRGHISTGYAFDLRQIHSFFEIDQPAVRETGPVVRDFEGMSFEQWLTRAREGHGTRIRDDRAARNAYHNGMDPVEFAETVAGGFLFTRRGRR